MGKGFQRETERNELFQCGELRKTPLNLLTTLSIIHRLVCGPSGWPQSCCEQGRGKERSERKEREGESGG